MADKDEYRELAKQLVKKEKKAQPNKPVEQIKDIEKKDRYSNK